MSRRSLVSLTSATPQPGKGELPSQFAYRLGQSFASTANSTRRQALGQFFTPVEVARFMASLALDGHIPQRVLDPGAGSGVLANAICELLPNRKTRFHLDAFEIDPELASLCHLSLTYAKTWLARKELEFTFEIHETDFILETAGTFAPRLFDQRVPRLYDLVIANPPYFKLQKSDPRSVVAAAVNHGQPNIYAVFMALAASALVDGGVMVTITPRSFATGDYFTQCRRHVFSRVVPEVVHLFDSRRAAFRDDTVLQENVILKARRASPTQHAVVSVSTSHGPADIAGRTSRTVALASVVEISSPNAVFHIPARETDVAIMRFLRNWPHTLHTLGLEASTGPVVAFRARRFLINEPMNKGHVPLLWLHNVRQMAIEWPAAKGAKSQYIVDSPNSDRILLPNRTYVLLRRFTAKEERKRLTAAPLMKGQLPGRRVGLENHLNYIHRPQGEIHSDEAFGLAALLSSNLIDRYFRISNGHTQVNATELRSIPLPSRQVLIDLGSEIRRGLGLPMDIDLFMERFLGIPDQLGLSKAG